MPERFELKDFECVHNLLLGITEEMLGEKMPLPAAIESIQQGTPPPEAAAVAAGWLWLLDAGIGPHHFRNAIERLNPPESELQALLRYFARKKPPRELDIERLEWLVTHMFRKPSTSGGHSSSIEMLRNIERWLEERPARLSGNAEALLSELVEILEDLVSRTTLRELTQSELIDRGRRLKQGFKEEFVHPQVLAAVVNYNLVSGRRFAQLLSEALAGSTDFPPDLPTREYRSAAEDLRHWTGEAEVAAVATAPENLAGRIRELGIDQALEEGRLLSMMSGLASFAGAAGKPVSTIPLPHSSLTLAPWEAQSLVVEYPGTEKSFRAELNRALRRAVCLLAAIQEEITQYEIKRHSEHAWKKHVNTLIYLVYGGRENLAELEKQAQAADGRGLRERAEQLAQTAARLRQKLDEVSELYKQWKEPSA